MPTVEEIRKKMEENSAAWHTADEAGKAKLANDNQNLGASIGAKYDPSGTWDYSGAKGYDAPSPSPGGAWGMATNALNTKTVGAGGLVQPQLNTSTVQAPVTKLSGISYKPKDDLSERIRSKYMTDLENQIGLMNQELARSLQAGELAVNQNNTYLQDRIKQLTTEQNIGKEQAATLQNRRGGWYSGGLDYQRGQIDNASIQAKEGVSRDIGQRNADIYAKNQLLAQQAYDNISKLRSQAPAKIQELIQSALAEERQLNMQEAGLTGSYNGSPTLAAQNQSFNQTVTAEKLAMEKRDQRVKEASELSQMFGIQVDPKEDYELMLQQVRGRPTVAQQTAAQKAESEARSEAWKVVDMLGYVPSVYAEVLGVPAGTQTAQAKQAAAQLAIQERNAATSEKNAETSRMNATKTPTTSASAQSANTYISNLNKRYVATNPTTKEPMVTDEAGLERAILALNLPPDQTRYLYEYYGLEIPE